MKEGTVVTIVAICFALSGFSISLVSGLAQWLNTGEWPPGIVWVVVLGACVGSAANSVIAFFSKKYANYMISKSNGNTPPTT